MGRVTRPLICIITLFALVATSCGSPVGEDAVPDSLPLLDTDTTSVAAPVTSTTSTTTTSTTTTSTIPPDPLRTWVATAKPQTPYLLAYDEPNGTPIQLEFLVPNPHQFGGPLTLMVTEGQPGDEWVQVQLPVRPNGQVGWIKSSGYEIAGTRVRAEVVLSERMVRVYDGEELIAETLSVIGADATPTPLGTFFIAAKRENPESEYYLGPWALALSSYSEVHETFSGGIPVIAIHGTNRPEQVGDARSNGCIRVPNEVVTFLAEHVPLGAPITISA